MKNVLSALMLLPFLLWSCSSIQVVSDHDAKVDFKQYHSFAYHKNAIDKANISDLDKKRILRAIDDELLKKGFVKNENPDILVAFFTQANDQVNVNQWGSQWGWGWGPGFWGASTTVSTVTEGTLVIDFIDAKTKELVWQGTGYGALYRHAAKKEERIIEFVSKILAQYPPQSKK